MTNYNAKPKPQGNYLTASRSGLLIFTAGMTPRKENKLVMTGKIKESIDLNVYNQVVRLASENALNSVKQILRDEEVIKQIIQLNIFINATDDFTSHSVIADFASAYLYEMLGVKGIGSRAAIGVSSLPGNSPIEIQLTAEVGRN